MLLFESGTCELSGTERLRESLLPRPQLRPTDTAVKNIVYLENGALCSGARARSVSAWSAVIVPSLTARRHFWIVVNRVVRAARPRPERKRAASTACGPSLGRKRPRRAPATYCPTIASARLILSRLSVSCLDFSGCPVRNELVVLAKLQASTAAENTHAPLSRRLTSAVALARQPVGHVPQFIAASALDSQQVPRSMRAGYR
jgi:hypothetical protein